MTDTTLVWKGSKESQEGIAVITYGDLSVTVDLPCFAQAHHLANFINGAMHRASVARVKATAATVRGLLDSIS